MRPLLLVTLALGAPGVAGAGLFDGLPDPTRPYAAAAPEAREGGLALQSILIAPDRRLAVISGRAYAVGARLGTWEVAAIRANEVTLRDGGKEMTLQLLPAPPLKRPRLLMEAKRHDAP